jgi:hypothetical protein
MKNLFLPLAMLLLCISVKANEYYISTTGSDSNPGTIDQPFKTFQKINKLTLSPGDIVYIRAGTYKSGATGDSPQYALLIDGKNGTSSNWITIAAYPGDFANGGRVVLDCSDFKHTKDYVGIQIQNSSYILIKGIRVTGIPQTIAGQVCLGWFILNNPGGNITLENCEADHIAHNGFRHHNTSNMTFLNCDAHHIDNPYDPGIQRHGGSDGFGMYDASNTSQKTLYKNCRAWFCSDDGWDVNNAPGTATYDGCWAFWSGYVQDVFPLTHTAGGVSWGDGNGFKLGGDATPKDYSTTKRIVKRCLSFENYANGFDQNLANIKMEFVNNTAYRCTKRGFFIYTQTPAPMTAYNNLVYDCTDVQNFISGVTTQSNNSWNTVAPAAGDFISLANTGVDGARQADGSLPNLSFLHLSSGSKLIDAGVNILSMLFSGSAPDLGAFEYGGTTSTANQAPVAKAGTDKTITLPTSTITLDGSASTDADGNITAYKWAKISGGTATISNSAGTTTAVTGLVAGQYTFELTVTDNKAASATAQIKVIVNDAGNKVPVANAGTTKSITLPANTVTLDGSASSDADGNIASYNWTKISGGAATIVNSTMAATTVSGLVAGQYTFNLKVTDNKGASSESQVTVNVNATGQDASGSIQPDPTNIDTSKSAMQLKVYPNPATNVINAEVTNAAAGTPVLNIYDMNGRLVKKARLDKQLSLTASSEKGSTTIPVDITSLGHGVYIIEIIIGLTTRVTSKFVKS